MLAGVLLGALAAEAAEAAPGRVASLDQCADQYVLALAPRRSIAALSPRADDADAWLRSQAAGLPRRRATFEAMTAVQPDLVVRYWGGDPRLLRALQGRGAQVVQIEEATEFEGVRANIRRVAAALERRAEGEALIRDMDARLARSRGAWKGQPALYMTPSGFTAGPGTLIDAMLRAAGLTNAAKAQSWEPVPLERMILSPPSLFVFGFFDARRGDRWGLGRHPLIAGMARGRTVASLPGSMLGCPLWAQAVGAERLAGARR
jgi:iron complex transport system substrate-binding protein